MLHKLRSKLRKFSNLSSSEKLLFSEAFLTILFTGLVLKIIPFRHIPKLFKSSTDSIPAPERVAEIVKKAVIRSGSLSPWKNRCLVQSLAARRMLNHRKFSSRLYLGLTKADDKLLAHAWISTGDTEIVAKGGEYKGLLVF